MTGFRQDEELSKIFRRVAERLRGLEKTHAPSDSGFRAKCIVINMLEFIGASDVAEEFEKF